MQAHKVHKDQLARIAQFKVHKAHADHKVHKDQLARIAR
jgi:hypothetical protein